MNRARILIVEDEAIIAKEMESQLQSLGYEVTSIVDTGEKAIAKAEEDNPDIILMDIRIKGEMDGISTAEAIRNKFDIPVIFSTAYLDQERIERAKLTMPFGYVLKPIQVRDLKVTLEMALYVAKVDENRRKAEIDVLESEKKYQDLYDNAPDMFASIDAKTTLVIECNQTLVKAIGYSKEKIIGSSVFNLYTSESATYAKDKLFPLFLNTGKIDGEVLHLRKKNGGIIDVSLSVSAVRDSGGNILHSRSIWHDITEKKQLEKNTRELERQVQQMQKMEAIGTLASGIAHDFNNILHPIVGYASLGQKLTTENDQFHQYFSSILDSSTRAKELVKQILNFSRQTEQELRPLKLQPVIREVIHMLRSSFPSTIQIEQQLDENCGMIMGDITKVHQIIMNIATNAFYAMSKTGGTMKVSLKTSEMSTDTSRYVCLTISDTGEGMSADTQQKIFDAYYTTKKEGQGTGLGLFVVQSIVNRLGGYIKVSSEIGAGTEFKVLLPQIIEETAKTAKVEELIPTGGNERILLVDDESVIASLESEMLERLGYNVTSMTNSLSALEFFNTHPNDIDLLITDMRMPGISGIQLASHFLSIRPDIPIIICSGFSESIDQQSAKIMGIKEILMKPLTFNQFAGAVRKALDKKIQVTV